MLKRYQSSIVIESILLIITALLLVTTFVLFRKVPPAIDTYHTSSAYDSVDVILSKAFIVTCGLYLMSIILLVVSVVRMVKIQHAQRIVSLMMLRIVAMTLFIAVTAYLLGYLGFYDTFNIRFVMPFREYHPPF